MKINFIPNKKDHFGADILSEVEQTSEDLMAIGVQEGEVIKNFTPWFHCREFFNDYISYYYLQRQYEIYGFTLPPLDDVIHYWDNMVLLVRVHNKKYSNRVLKEVTKMVEDLEKEAFGKMFSTIELDDDRKHLIINFNRYWVVNPYLFSLFTREVRWGYLIAMKKYVESDRWDRSKLKYPEKDTNIFYNWDTNMHVPVVYNNAVIQYIASLPIISDKRTSSFTIHGYGYVWLFAHEYSNIKSLLQGSPKEL